MGSTFESLLESFIAARDIDYRTDPERDEGRLQVMESTVQAMLELLRDKFDRRATSSSLDGNPAKGFGGTLLARE